MTNSDLWILPERWRTQNKVPHRSLEGAKGPDHRTHRPYSYRLKRERKPGEEENRRDMHADSPPHRS